MKQPQAFESDGLRLFYLFHTGSVPQEVQFVSL